MITFLTIFNTFFNLVLILRYFKIHEKFSFEFEKTSHLEIIYGISFYYGNLYSQKGFLYIPLRNAHKTVLRDELSYYSTLSKQNLIQKLTAKFSWLRTLDEVEKFQKNYGHLNPVLVEELVKDFKRKINFQ